MIYLGLINPIKRYLRKPNIQSNFTVGNQMFILWYESIIYRTWVQNLHLVMCYVNSLCGCDLHGWGHSQSPDLGLQWWRSQWAKTTVSVLCSLGELSLWSVWFSSGTLCFQLFCVVLCHRLIDGLQIREICLLLISISVCSLPRCQWNSLFSKELVFFSFPWNYPISKRHNGDATSSFIVHVLFDSFTT